MDDRILDYLCGRNRIDERIGDLLDSIQESPVAAGQQAAVDQLLGVLRDPEQRKRYTGVNLFGPPGCGRRTVASRLCAQLGLDLFSLAPSRMPGTAQERRHLLRLLGREAMLSRFAVYLQMDDTDSADAAITAEVVERIPVFFVRQPHSRLVAAGDAREEAAGARCSHPCQSLEDGAG